MGSVTSDRAQSSSARSPIGVPRRAISRPIVAGVASLSALLLIVSQTGAVYDGDEGLHLVGAMLVRAGQRPFVDFFYWHEPIYLYVAAAWMTIAGESWRSVHLLSAALTAVTAFLIASYLPGYIRAKDGPAWWGLVAASCFALSVLVLKWGTIGHNYALCLMLSVVAFRLAAGTVNLPGVSRSFWAGLFAGAAAATSLLVSLLVPVMLLWLVICCPAGTRLTKAASFLAGAIIPFSPLALLASQAPYETFFGLVDHHLTYRVPVSYASAIHVETLSSWMTSPQALLLIFLAGIGMVTVARDGSSDTRRDAYLCAALALSLGIFAAVAHPPARMPYFVVATPFVAILAAIGAFTLTRRSRRVRGHWMALAVVVIFGLGALASFYRERLWTSEWRRIEAFAEEVNRVSAPGGSFYTSYPFVYFAARRLPPEGLENGWATRMMLPLESFTRLEVMSDARLVDRVRSGFFDTTLLGRDDPRYEAATMERAYRDSMLLDPSFVLRWNPRRPSGENTAEPARRNP